jgi:hypothetical protein
MGHPRIKHTRGLSTRDSISTTKGAALRVGAAIMVEAPIQSNLHTAYIMVAKPTTAPKTVPSSWGQREKWSWIL